MKLNQSQDWGVYFVDVLFGDRTVEQNDKIYGRLKKNEVLTKNLEEYKST